MTTSGTTNSNPRRRRNRTAVALTGLALVAVAGTVTAASAHSAGTGRPSADASGVLRFGVQFSPFNVIDVPPLAQHEGDYRPGDYAVFSDVLTDRKGAKVGVEGGSGLITKVTPTGAQVHFTMTIQLHSGSITAQGLSSTAPHKRLALTGGTGRYVGAQGHLDLVEHGDGTGTLVVDLRR
jgi:allene oxide cyclase-like protein